MRGDEVLLDIPVCVSKVAFRIRPSRSRMLKAGFLKRGDDCWYLIHTDVVRSGCLSSLWKAALYEAREV